MKKNPAAILRGLQGFRRAFSTTAVRRALEFTDQHRALQSTVSKVCSMNFVVNSIQLIFFNFEIQTNPCFWSLKLAYRERPKSAHKRMGEKRAVWWKERIQEVRSGWPSRPHPRSAIFRSGSGLFIYRGNVRRDGQKAPVRWHCNGHLGKNLLF